VTRPPRASRFLTGAWIAFGAGGAALTTGVVTGVVSLRASASLTAGCTAGHCPTSDSGSAASIGRLADAATGTLVVGAIAVAAGTALVIAHARGLDKPATLRLGPGLVGGSF
jgi:hypothetical protein